MTTDAEPCDATRQAIVAAAARVIVEHGEQGFSTTAVATEAGLSNGDLFRHFPTRKELVVATVEHVLANARHRYRLEVVDLQSGNGWTPQRIEVVFEAIWRALTDPRRLALLEFYTNARTDPDLRARLEPVVANHDALVADITSDAMVGADGGAADLGRELITMAQLALRGVAVDNLVGSNLGAERHIITTLTAAFLRAVPQPADPG